MVTLRDRAIRAVCPPPAAGRVLTGILPARKPEGLRAAAGNQPAVEELPKPSLVIRSLPFWMGLAVLAQLFHLAYWPLTVLGVELPRGAAVAVALVRLGLYAGLGWGLLQRQPAAWAGAVLELARTFLLFAVLALLHRGTGRAPLYPADWAQALLGCGLPFLYAVRVALGAGWRPGPGLEPAVFTAVQLLAGFLAISAVSLQRERACFNVSDEQEGRVLLLQGVPFVLVLSAVELGALVLSARGGW